MLIFEALSKRGFNLRTPCIRAQILRMLREKPVVSVQILDSVLALAIHRHLEILNNLRARRFCSFKMSIHILDEHSQALRSTA